MNPHVIFVLLGILLLTNAVIVYFTFSTWYGHKKIVDMIPVWYDEEGTIKFEEKLAPLDTSDNEVHHSDYLD